MKLRFIKIKKAGFCSLLVMSCGLASPTWADSPAWTSVYLSVADGETSEGLTAGNNANVSQSDDGLVCAIELKSGGSMGTIAGGIYVEAENSSAVAYLAGSLDYSGIGLYSEDTGDSQGFDVDWSTLELLTQLTGGANTDTSYGVLLNEVGSSIATGAGEAIGGLIFATNTSSSSGNSIAIAATAGTAVGDLATSGNVISYNKGSGDSTAISLQGDASMGAIAGAVSATADEGNATAILLDEGSSIGVISGAVEATAETITSQAVAISSSSASALVFADNAVVSATVGSFFRSVYGTALENTSYGLNLVSLSGTTSFSGNLNAGNQAIVLTSGLFTAASDSWTSVSVALGGGTLEAMDVSQLELTDSTSFTATTLSFYVDGVGNFSCIGIADGESLTLSSVTDITIYISNSMAEIGDFSLQLIDGAIVGLSESVSVNYVVDGAYVSTGLSVGSDGTGMVLSGALEAVPEPSTATLSLLALAALGWRRRRK